MDEKKNDNNEYLDENNQRNIRKKYLSQIEKRGNFHQKLFAHSFQRHSVKQHSLSDNTTFFSIGNKNNIFKEEEEGKKKEINVRQFINNRIIVVNEKKKDIDEFFNVKNMKGILPNIKKTRFKFHVFHDKNGLQRDLTKSNPPVLKMTREKLRDIKILSSIAKIRDPDIIEKYKSLIN